MLIFLRCVGGAVAAKGARGLAGLVPMGQQIYEIAEEAIKRYRRECREARLREDVEEMVKASSEQVRHDAREIAREALADRPPEEVARLEQYLAQVPAVARQSLVRPDDPIGKSVPAAMNLTDPVQLGALLPRRLPRFQSGETVPGSPQWRFVELLGAGGFGEVWLARHSFLDQQRAIKFCLDLAARDRLLRHEGEVIRQVMRISQGMRPDQHGIVPLVDVYLDGDTPWLAYEYVDGGDLSTIVRKHAGLPAEERGRKSLQYLAALADVIGRFHTSSRPIIHRDLKPANTLLKRLGKKLLLRVTDFGISHVEADRGIRQATVSTPQISLGETYRGAHTPIYASPQQKRGSKPDVRDDVHALGIIGWQLLLGDLGAERPAGKWRKRLAECGLSDAVLDVLESCWDDEPDERPANAAVLVEQLRKHIAKRRENRTEDIEPKSPGRTEIVVVDSLGEGWEKVSEDAGVPIFRPLGWEPQILKALTDPAGPFGLDLRHCNEVTDAGIAHLAGLSNLRSLYLGRCDGVTDAGLAHLAALSNLQKLHLRGCEGVTDAGLAHLAALSNLRALYLWGCKGLTDAGLAHLAALSRLQKLDLWKCEGVTGAGVAELQRALPNCDIFH